LQVDPGGDSVLAQFLSCRATPLARAISFLYPADSNAVPNLAGGDAGAELDNLAHRFVPARGERKCEQTVSKVNIGVAEAAGVDL